MLMSQLSTTTIDHPRSSRQINCKRSTEKNQHEKKTTLKIPDCKEKKSIIEVFGAHDKT